MLGKDYIKTAFFQLKVSHEYQVSLSLDQLNQTSEFAGVHERSFVLAVDDPRCGYRIASVEDCQKEFRDGAKTRSFDTSSWEYLSEWLPAWFKCDRAPVSSDKDPKAVEPLLEKYRQAATRERFEDTILANLPTEVRPAKGWLRFTFRSRG
jgi:hypothetical protein